MSDPQHPCKAPFPPPPPFQDKFHMKKGWDYNIHISTVCQTAFLEPVGASCLMGKFMFLFKIYFKTFFNKLITGHICTNILSV